VARCFLEYINSRASSLPRAQRHLDEVAELLGGELVAFEIGGDFAGAVDHHRVKHMRQQSFVLPEVQAEAAGHLLHFRLGAREEVPLFRVGFPRLGVTREDLGPIVDGVDRDRKEDEVAAHAIG